MSEEIKNPQNSIIPESQPDSPSTPEPAPGNGKHHIGQSYKFNADHIKQLIAGLAKFYTHNQIVDEFNKINAPITISHGGLELIAKNYKKEIGFIRQQWLERLSDEPAVHKRVRIRELWKHYNIVDLALEKIKDNPEKNKEIQGLNKSVSDTLQAIRVEVEGQRVNLTVTPLHTLDDPDLLDKAHEIYSKHKIETAEFTEIKPNQE
jgi:hypothetical protein